MAVWNNTVTNKGIALQTKQLNGAPISFTRVVAGSGVVPVLNLKEQTGISEIKQNLTVERLTIGDGVYTINVLLANNTLTSGYNLSQIGFYATDPDEGEILFAICQIDHVKPIPTSSEAPGYNIEFAFTFKNTNNATVEITPDLAGLATIGEVKKLIAENAGADIELAEDITE